MASDAPASSAEFSPPPRRLILASSSPRRQELLKDAGYSFDVHPADIDEDDFPATSLPIDVAMKLAIAKARTISAKYPDDVILAADTLVAFGDMVIGKPDDPAHAREILRLLSGATHIVVTAMAVAIDSSKYLKTARVLSCVRIKWISEIELERYLASGSWRGKAGGYGLQDPGALVENVVGCRTNVIGLPMTTARAMLADAGVKPSP